MRGAISALTAVIMLASCQAEAARSSEHVEFAGELAALDGKIEDRTHVAIRLTNEDGDRRYRLFIHCLDAGYMDEQRGVFVTGMERRAPLYPDPQVCPAGDPERLHSVHRMFAEGASVALRGNSLILTTTSGRSARFERDDPPRATD